MHPRSAIWVIVSILVLVGFSCNTSLAPTNTTPAPIAATPPIPTTVAAALVMFPVDGYAERRTVKVHGQFVDDRFHGYHIGDDVEFTDTTAEILVRAIADGVIRRHGWVSGYGNMMIIEHRVGEETVLVTYGHLDLAKSTLRVGDSVVRGQHLANLGDGGTPETDGERHHLHFAIRPAGSISLRGYAATKTELAQWINPSEFFTRHGVPVE